MVDTILAKLGDSQEAVLAGRLRLLYRTDTDNFGSSHESVLGGRLPYNRHRDYFVRGITA
jgi:hypothetical protein